MFSASFILLSDFVYLKLRDKARVARYIVETKLPSKNEWIIRTSSVSFVERNARCYHTFADTIKYDNLRRRDESKKKAKRIRKYSKVCESKDDECRCRIQWMGCCPCEAKKGEGR